MKTAILNTEPIIEDTPLRSWAREAVDSYYQRCRLEAVTVREGSGGQSWLPETVLFYMGQQVVKPVRGEIARRLYGK